jgi:Tol biopolymer transport system component/predicted Ser/Thr protein kinase
VEISALWRQGRPPDLGAFLARAGSLSAEELVDVLCVDQRERWLRGERPPAENYLKVFRSFHGEDEYAVDILYNEYRLRRDLGEAPVAGEYTRRFPDLAEQLRLQVGMHEALYPPAPAADTVSLRGGAETPPPAAGTPFPAPPSVPGYTLERVLGRGGMGVVYLARQERLKRQVALKMLHPAGAAEEADPARFRAEAEAAARLQHSHIVQVYEVGDHEGRPFLVMELVEGESLAQRLSGGPLASGQAAELLETLALAAHYAHTRGVVHRDIKPANVLLQADGAPKLTDFGLARRLDVDVALTPTGQVLGTPGYMAPEQARGGKGVGPPADVYALGAILYECLTGRPPFQGATAYETVLQVLQQDPAPPRRLRPAVPRDLETVCLKCLEKNPQRRYASAADLAGDLRRYLDGRPVTARPTGPLGRALRWAARRPAAAALLVCVAAALLAFVGRGLWLERQQAARRDQARQAIAAALDEAEALRAEVRGADGLKALARVELLLADADSDDLRRRLEQMKAALQEMHAAEIAATRLREGVIPGASRVEHDNVAFDVSPDGETIVFSAADGDLYLLHLPTSRVSRLTAGEDRKSTPAFSPDGKAVAYAAGPKDSRAQSLYVRSIDGKKVRRLTDAAGVSDRVPAFSPDGSQVVFARAHRQRPHGMGGWTWDQWDVCVIGSDGSGLCRVTRESYYSLDSVYFSRAGKEVLYSATVPRGDGKLVTLALEIDVAGAKPPRALSGDPPLGEFAVWAGHPRPTPDGKRAVVVSDRAQPYRYDLLVVDLDGAKPSPLGVTAVGPYNQQPLVTPDGKGVLFLAGVEKNAFNRPIYSLWRVDLGGGRPVRIADSGLFSDPQHWKPRPGGR